MRRRRAGDLTEPLERPALDLVVGGKSHPPTLVIARRLQAQPSFTFSHLVDRHQIYGSARREVHAKDVSQPNVRKRTPTVVGHPAIEDRASATQPGGLALDSQEGSGRKVNNQIVRLSASERHKHIETPVHECI
jgi:hypothetical protein